MQFQLQASEMEHSGCCCCTWASLVFFRANNTIDLFSLCRLLVVGFCCQYARYSSVRCFRVCLDSHSWRTFHFVRTAGNCSRVQHCWHLGGLKSVVAVSGLLDLWCWVKLMIFFFSVFLSINGVFSEKCLNLFEVYLKIFQFNSYHMVVSFLIHQAKFDLTFFFAIWVFWLAAVTLQCVYLRTLCQVILGLRRHLAPHKLSERASYICYYTLLQFVCRSVNHCIPMLSLLL